MGQAWTGRLLCGTWFRSWRIINRLTASHSHAHLEQHIPVNGKLSDCDAAPLFDT